MANDGYISPLALIGSPPEHRDYRWLSLDAGEAIFFPPFISPTAIVEAFVSVDAGLERRTHIGDRVYLMKHSHVGHDAIVGSYSNVAPGAIIGGYCRIGHHVKIGLGASIRPRVTIGNYAIIGAGAVVVKHVPEGEVWAGNPAANLGDKLEHPYSTETIWDEWYESWHR